MKGPESQEIAVYMRKETRKKKKDGRPIIYSLRYNAVIF